jgi:hypothetical protein
MGKQRAMNVLVKRIRGNAPATVVAFGDGRFNPHIRGHPPAAVMGLRRALARASCRVFEVNEHMTSQVRVNFLSVFSGFLVRPYFIRARYTVRNDCGFLGH